MDNPKLFFLTNDIYLRHGLKWSLLWTVFSLLTQQ